MKVADIKPGMSNISVTARVVSVSTPRRVYTRYGWANVAEAVIEDETGEIVLTLWRDQIEAVAPGMTIRVEGAYSKKFRDRIEISVGKGGSITVLEK